LRASALIKERVRYLRKTTWAFDAQMSEFSITPEKVSDEIKKLSTSSALEQKNLPRTTVPVTAKGRGVTLTSDNL
jgi:hypothetical protein